MAIYELPSLQRVPLTGILETPEDIRRVEASLRKATEAEFKEYEQASRKARVMAREYWLD